MEYAFELVNDKDERIISYQSNPDLEGLGWLGILFNIIAKRKTAVIIYQAFGKDAKKLVVHPHHLKQYNNRWFLIATTDGYDTFSNYSLDRIKDVEEAGIDYKPTTINWLDYFDEMIGVSKVEGQEPVKIHLKFSPHTINYIKTKPLSGTQKILKTDTSGLSVLIEVIPNFELFQKLLSFGADVEVISPPEIRKQMSKISNEMYEIYKYAE
jgi:predicted DNA-binding transcriptional regulator YafY